MYKTALQPTLTSLLSGFKSYLLTLKLSPISRKLYLSDLRRFLSSLELSSGYLSLDALTSHKLYRDYLADLHDQAFAPSMIKRTLASLKQFGQYLALTHSIPNPVSIPFSAVPTTHENYIKHFINYLKEARLSPSTIKSYKSDVSRYLDWVTSLYPSTKISSLLSSKNHEKYLTYLSESESALPTTIERKSKSLARFQGWHSSAYAPSFTSDNAKTRREPQNTDILTPDSLMSPDTDKSFVKNIYSRMIFSAVLLLFTATLAIFGYRQFARDATLIAAYPSTPVVPNRQLSFQGRLENASGTPITTATNMVFKLFNASTVGTELYSSGTCSIDPDADGVFNTQIGDTCGSAIAATVFTENQDVWLEVTIAAETLDPRQQIATVAYALNSETLQGFPLSSTVSAIRNTVVPMNQWGEILVGEQSPRMTGISGTFAISAPALSLTTASGTNGNISIAPDGTGQVNLTGNTTSTNFFNVSNAQVTSGSLITGTVGNANTGFKLIDLLSGSSPTSKFSVTDAGNVTLAGDLTITGGNVTSATTFDSTLTVTGDLTSNANTTIGNANSDTLTINAGTSGTGIAFGDSSFATCTALETVGGVLTCGSDAGGATAWDDIGDPDAGADIAFAEYAQTMSWNTAASSAAYDGLTLQITNDATTDGGSQRLLVLNNVDDAISTGTTESLLVLVNNDANEAVTDAISFAAGGAGTDFTYGINFDAASIGTAELILSNSATIANTADGTLVLTEPTIQLAGSTSVDINSPLIDLGTQTVDVTLNNAVDALNFDSNTLSIDALNNRVGIGVNNPSQSLQVGGNILLNNGSWGDEFIYFGDTNFYIGATDGTGTDDDLVIAFLDTGDRDFRIYGTSSTNNLLTVTPGGRLGVNHSSFTASEDVKFGDGTDGDYWVNVHGKDSLNAAFRLVYGIYSGDDTAFMGTATNHGFAFRTNNTNRLTISNTGLAEFTNTAQVLGEESSGLIRLKSSATGGGRIRSQQTFGSNTAGDWGVHFDANNARVSGLDNQQMSIWAYNGSFVSPFALDDDQVYINGNLGIGTTAPDARLEINHATGDNLRLTYNDADGTAANYTDFSLSSSGDLTIDSSGGQVYLADTDTLNVGGLTAVAYNAFANSGEAPEEAAISSDNDLYIGGDLEVDGTIYGSVSGSSGSVAWDDITTPNADLTLSHSTYNTIFDSGATTGTFFTINADSLTSGKALSLVSDSATVSTAFTGDVASIAYSPTYTGGVALDTTGNVLDISRSTTLNNVGNTLTVSGAVASISDSGTQTAGTLTSTADVLRVAQNYTGNTGSALDVTSAGGATGFALRVNDDGTFTDSTPFVVTNTGNVGVGTSSPNTGLGIGTSGGYLGVVYGTAGSTTDVEGVRIGTSTGATNETGVIKWDNVATAGSRSLLLDTWGSANPIKLGGSEVILANEGGTFTELGAGTLSPAVLVDIATDSTWNSDSTAGLAVSNRTTQAKRISFGFDGAADIGYIQAHHVGTAIKGLVLNPNGGNVGIGDTSPDAFLNVKGTTEQLRLDYDDSNYASFTVASTGRLTIAGTGSAADIFFHGSTYNLSTTGDLTIGGRITFENAEYIENETNGTVNIGTSILGLVGGTSLVSDQTSFDLFNTTTTTLNVAGAATTLNLGAGGALTRTINVGTGTGADTINIGTGGTTADAINIGGLTTTQTNFTGDVNFAGGTTYYVDEAGNAKFNDIIAADTGNPGLTVGDGTTGFIKVGSSTIMDNATTYMGIDPDSDAVAEFVFTNAGLFGIGITDPTYTLDVAGNGRISSNATTDDTVKTTTTDFTVSGSTATSVTTTSNQVTMSLGTTTMTTAAGPALTANAGNTSPHSFQRPDGKFVVVLGNGTVTTNIYDPATDAFTAGPNLTLAAYAGAHSIQRPDGKFVTIIASGSTTTNIYDPATNAFTAGPALTAAAQYGSHSFQRPDGKFVTIHGNVLSSTSIYDPATNAFTAGPALTTTVVYGSHSFQRPDGKFITIIGDTTTATNLYDPATNTFSAGPALSAGAYGGSHSFQRPDGKFVTIHGNVLSSTSIYDPATNTYSAGPALTANAAYGSHSLQRPDGTFVTIIGNDSTTTNIYDPATNTFSAGTALTANARFGSHSFQRPDGKFVTILGNASTTTNILDLGWNTSGTWESEPLSLTKLSANSTLSWNSNPQQSTNPSRIDQANIIYQARTTTSACNQTNLDAASYVNIKNSGDLIPIASGATCIQIKANFNVSIPANPLGSTFGIQQSNVWMGESNTSYFRTFQQPTVYDLTINNSLIQRGGGDPSQGNTFAQQSATLENIVTDNSNTLFLLPDKNINDNTTNRGVQISLGPVLSATANNGAHSFQRPDGKFITIRGNVSTTTNIYDPATNAFTAGPALTANANVGAHSFQRPDGKFVTIIGNSTTSNIYDPATNAFTAGPALTATVSTGAHSFQRPDGKFVTILAGTTTTTNIYDPATNSFTAGPALTATAGAGAHSFQRPDGRFLVVLANGTTATSIYDPTTNSFTAGPVRSSLASTGSHSFQRPDGKFISISANGTTATSIYDPETNAFTAGPTLTAGPSDGSHSIQRPDGKFVTIRGGGTAVTNIYDPATNAFTAGPSLTAGAGTSAHSFQRPDGKFVTITANTQTTTNILDLGWNLSGTYISEQINNSNLSTSTALYWTNKGGGTITAKVRSASSAMALGQASWTDVEKNGSLINSSGNAWIQVRFDLIATLPGYPGAQRHVWVGSGAGGLVAYYRTPSSPILSSFKLTNTGQPSILTLESAGLNIFRFTADGSAYTNQTGAWYSGGADVAEYYSSSQELTAGEVVAIDPNNGGGINHGVVRSTKAYQDSLLGIVSTQPGFVAGAYLEGGYPIALVGRVPVKIAPDSPPIIVGDFLTSSSTHPGMAMKATETGVVIGKALESWNLAGVQEPTTIEVFVNLSWYDPSVLLSAIGNIQFSKELADAQHYVYKIFTTASNGTQQAIDKISLFSQLAVANLKAGLITAQEIIANLSIQTPELNVDQISSLTPDEAIVFTSPVVIKPTDDGTTKPEPLLLVEGEIEAATISARLAKLDEIKVEKLTAGDIVADSITANSIIGLDAKIATFSTGLSDSELTTITDRIKARIQELSGNIPTATEIPLEDLDPDLIADTLEATESADPNLVDLEGVNIHPSLSADFVSVNDYLAVIGQATITTLDVTNTLYTETVNAKSGTLALQPLGGIVKIAGDTLIADSLGNVSINGNLTVTGELRATSLLGNLLEIYDEGGSVVGSIDASGSATLNSLTTQIITIASASDASGSATPSALAQTLGFNVESNATAGTATLVTPNTELTINSPHVSPDTLVYLTPTTNTDNKVLFVKSKETCAQSSDPCTPSFTVAVDASASTDISFNWWIIKLQL